jgi:hypothetical protein
MSWNSLTILLPIPVPYELNDIHSDDECGTNNRASTLSNGHTVLPRVHEVACQST